MRPSAGPALRRASRVKTAIFWALEPTDFITQRHVSPPGSFWSACSSHRMIFWLDLEDAVGQTARYEDVYTVRVRGVESCVFDCLI
jgi:hypothetical protein